MDRKTVSASSTYYYFSISANLVSKRFACDRTMYYQMCLHSPYHMRGSQACRDALNQALGADEGVKGGIPSFPFHTPKLIGNTNRILLVDTRDSLCRSRNHFPASSYSFPDIQTTSDNKLSKLSQTNPVPTGTSPVSGANKERRVKITKHPCCLH